MTASTDEVIMDAAQQPKKRLKAFLKHATIRISSSKHHGFSSDSASAYSIDDDGRSQRSSNSGKKDSKLRRIGRGIREWRSKRRRMQGDARPVVSRTLEGKSFSSSEASLSGGSFQNEDFTDEDEPVDRTEHNAAEASEGVREEALGEKLPWEICHEEVAARQGTRQHATPRETSRQTQPSNEVTFPAPSVTLATAPVYSSLVRPDVASHDRNLKPSGIVLRRDNQRAFGFARSISDEESAAWADTSHRPVGLEGRSAEHHGTVEVAQELDKRWTVSSAHASGVRDTRQLESLAILMALQRAVQEKKSGTLGAGTVYICISWQWIEKVLALATAIREAAQEAHASGADADNCKHQIRFPEGLDRRQVLRFSEYTRPKKSLAASIGRRILEQYHELLRLGARVEFHWAQPDSGLPGNEFASHQQYSAAILSAKMTHGTCLVTPSKMLSFDEPWTRYCSHKDQPKHHENEELQLMKDTKSLHIFLPTEVLGPGIRDTTTAGIVGARPGPCIFALQPATQSSGRLLHPPPGHPPAGVGAATVTPSNPPIRTEYPNHDTAFELRHQVVPMPVSQPPPPPPQPQFFKKARTKKQGKKRPATFEDSQCVHCWRKGHQSHQCFEMFPELKLAFPQRYARYVGRPRLEKVIPGAFHNLARLHPQLMQQPIRGQDSRLVGLIGIPPHLTPKQCTAWAVRHQAVQPARETTAAETLQNHSRDLRNTHHWDEARGAGVD